MESHTPVYDDKIYEIIYNKSKASQHRMMKQEVNIRRSAMIIGPQDHKESRKDRSQEGEKKIMDILETMLLK